MQRKLLVCVWAMAGLGIFVIGSCENAKEPVIKNCSTDPKNYTSHVKPVIDAFCKVCHQPGGAYSSLPLTSYTEVKNATQNGKLLNSIKHDGTAVAMPQGGGKLSDVDIATIDCWVTNNYPE
jgi:mono/diheme cytochrome c family protein